jgi:hypothetical protein
MGKPIFRQDKPFLNELKINKKETMNNETQEYCADIRA